MPTCYENTNVWALLLETAVFSYFKTYLQQNEDGHPVMAHTFCRIRSNMQRK